MLPDRYTELLTAYVDGDLSARQRRAVLKLLHRSSEARLLLKELQENAHALQNLPPRKLNPDFADGVLREIQVRGLQPGVAPPTPKPVPTVMRFPTWARFAAAAAVIAAAAFGGYLLISPDHDQDKPGPGPGPLVFETPKSKPSPSPAPPTSKVEPSLPPTSDPSPKPPVFVKKITPDPMIKQLIAGAFKDYTLNDLRLMPKQFGDPANKTMLAKEFDKNKSAVHLQWQAQNAGQSTQRLYDELRKQTRVLIDQHTDDLLKSKKIKPKTIFLVYAENLKPEELTAILGKSGVHGGDNIVVSALTNEHRMKLSNLMGKEKEKLPFLWNPIEGPGPKDKKEKKSDTITPFNSDALAVVMALDNADPKARSAQVAEFFRLKSLRTPRPGTLQVMLVIQSA
jgi:hypothetical protein